MKTHRMSRSVETRNGHRAMAARGRASLSRGALFDHPVVLTGRRFRRANKLTHAGAAMVALLVRRPDGATILPTITVDAGDHSSMVTGGHVTNT